MKLRDVLLLLALHIGILNSLADVEHIIKRGETIESIATLYGVTPESILKDNPLAKDMFYAGMILTIITDEQVPTSDNSNSKKDDNSGNTSSSKQIESSLNNRGLRETEKSARDGNETPQSEEESIFAKGRNFYGFQIGYLFPQESKSTTVDTRTYSY